jgi:hypothetical protein
LVFLRELAGSSRSSALCACSFQLLLIYDVESALSVLAAASAAVGACCLLVRGARRLCRVVQSFTDGWTARWAATSTMSGVVDGWGSSSDDWVARLPRGIIALL